MDIGIGLTGMLQVEVGKTIRANNASAGYKREYQLKVETTTSTINMFDPQRCFSR